MKRVLSLALALVILVGLDADAMRSYIGIGLQRLEQVIQKHTHNYTYSSDFTAIAKQ